MQVVKRHFRPEFLNRLDDVVVFEPLGKDHLRKIARLQARCPFPFLQNCIRLAALTSNSEL